MRIVLLTLVPAAFLLGQATDTATTGIPALIMFVAPAYPRAAMDARIMGKATTRITVNRNGVVTDAKTILAHPVFENDVLKALKQWRFKPSDHEHTFEVICVFELDIRCDGPSPALYHITMPETHVSAELPTRVHIKADWCYFDRG